MFVGALVPALLPALLSSSLFSLPACTEAGPSFTCGDAAAALGHPSAQVEACDAAPHLSDVYQVALSGGDLLGRQVYGVYVVDGKVRPDTGNAALSAFLDGLGPRAAALNVLDMIAVLRAFQAFPTGFDPSVSMFDLPDVGTTRVTATPFRFEMYNGRPPEPGFIKATLEGPPWVWTLAEMGEPAVGAPPVWRQTTQVPLR